MVFSVVDAGGLILAVLVCGAVVALPGFALGRLFAVAPTGTATDPLTGVTVGLAILPGLTSVVTRCLGLDVALALDLVLAAVGLVLLARGRPTISWFAAGLMAAWLALVLVEWIDIDIAGRLYQPLTAIDTVKHAATTQAILDSGAPPRDAFFLRPERASYYYFFYTLAALVQRACFGWVDAKSAVGGLIFWVGLGLYGLVRLALGRAGIELASVGKTVPLLIVAVLAAGGLDIVAVVILAWHQGYWIADPMQWNPQVSIWSQSLLWVPHHVTALIAGMVGLIAASDLVAGPARSTRNVALAGLSFAAALGLSVWVTLGLVVAAGAWGLLLLVERRWRALALLTVTGVLALLVAIPQIADLHAGRAAAPLPILVTVRAFALVDMFVPDGPWRLLARGLALPLNYFIEFGVLFAGAVLYWRQRRPVTEFGRVLTIAAASGLFLGTTLQSLLFNNDLGWRVMLFPLFAGTVWTIAVLDRYLARASTPTWRMLPVPLLGLLVLGWGTSLVTCVSLRVYPLLPLNPPARFIAADPQTERALRVAYGWADAHLPADNVLQHNPTRPRALAFGIYGRNRTALSDRYGSLYGADLDAVKARLDGLAPIYRDAMPDAEVRAIAARDGIDDLVVTAADPVWSQRGSFVWRSTPVYASDRVRIMSVTGLGG